MQEGMWQTKTPKWGMAEADYWKRLRKEWFLLLVREVFDPEHGMILRSTQQYSLSMAH